MSLYRNVVSFASCSAIAVALSAPAVNAQEAASDGFQFGVELDTQYDSNVGNLSEERAATREIQSDDVIFTPSIFASVNKTFGRFALRGNASLGYDFYAENTRLNSERAFADLTGETRLSLCTVQPGLSYRRQQNELGDRFFSDVADVPLDNVQTVQRYALDVACGREFGLRAIGGVAYEEGDNSAVEREFSDYNRMTYTAGLGYQHPSLGELDVFASKEDTDYDNRILDGFMDSYDVKRYGVTLSRNTGARITARVSAFMIDVDAPATGEDFEGLGWDVGVTARVGARTSFFYDMGQDVQPVLNNDALFMENRDWGAGASYALSERTTLSGSYRRSRKQYVYSDFLPPDDANPLLADTFDRIDASADFKGSGPLEFSLYGGYEKRSSNDDFYEYDGVFAGVRVRYLLGR